MKKYLSVSGNPNKEHRKEDKISGKLYVKP